MQLVPTESHFINSALQLSCLHLGSQSWSGCSSHMQLYQYFFSLGTVMETSNYCQVGTLLAPNNLLCILTVMWVGLDHAECIQIALEWYLQSC